MSFFPGACHTRGLGLYIWLFEPLIFEPLIFKPLIFKPLIFKLGIFKLWVIQAKKSAKLSCPVGVRTDREVDGGTGRTRRDREQATLAAGVFRLGTSLCNRARLSFRRAPERFYAVSGSAGCSCWSSGTTFGGR